jgi:protein SCO1/2
MAMETGARNPAQGSSVYAQTSSWETDTGMKMALSELKGRPAIVALFYTTCHVACPATIHELIDVERRLPADSKVAIVLVTIDPQTDTTATLSQCRNDNRLADRFILLRGSSADTRAFADAAGIIFRQEPARIIHVPKVVVLGRDGTIAASFPGTHSNTADVASAALKAEGRSAGS